MSETKACPKCGAELPADAPAGICPKCLMQAGLASEQDGGSGPDMKPTTLTSGFVPPAPEELAKHFPQLEILELLGKGGMGAVYKARQPGLDRLVAVKILPPEVGSDPAFAERFTREARALAKLSHQNIVSVFDSGEADGQYYFIMEYVDGANLRHVIETGAVKPEEALAIVPQICEALQFAHDAGIVHRDIKPENILVDKQGRVKIADFGLAKLLGKAPAEVTLTGSHQVMGTLHYMAPEQMQGAGSVDHRADIYSLGVVFYEMLTGQLPIGRFELPSRKVQVDVRLDEVVLRSLESEPDRRYQQVSEVKTEVEAITSDGLALTPPAVVSDSVLFRRMTVLNLILSSLWAAILVSFQWGYIADADWYFKKELPYSALVGWFLGLSLPLAVSLAWWWYVLAKRPSTPRSLSDFLRLAQTPDRRMRRVWKPALAYAGLFALAMVIAWPYGDAAQAVCQISGIILLPYVCMAVLRWAYAERFRPEKPQQGEHAEKLDSPADSPPRFSRKAIIGFCWAPFFFAALLSLITTSERVERERGSPVLPHNGVAVEETVQTVDDSRPSSDRAEFSGPTWWQWALIGTVLLLGLTAPFGTTVLGVVSINDIRHSRGRLTGLPLALADSLLYPLLLLDALIVGLFWLLCVVGYEIFGPGTPMNERAVWLCVGITALLSIPTCAYIDFGIVRAAWRKASGQSKSTKQASGFAPSSER
ncbi:MAG: protein kinase [Planctomycetes bacterium]|nr:protein kinase [Planctomycetota bacterium]